jgi:hypothetical protein
MDGFGNRFGLSYVDFDTLECKRHSILTVWIVTVTNGESAQRTRACEKFRLNR